MLMNMLPQPKRSPALQLLQLSALALTAAALAGCASSAYQKSDSAAFTMNTAAAEVRAESRALDVTQRALNSLVEEPAPDLKLQFRHFSDELDGLVSCAHRTENTGKKMALKS